ncbi:hypothetical protein CALVIDRAFT_597162 [Calocera viscosa TUFC12733]|uniref:tRNA (guanine(9)-N1)-methyltransferase n=1 Tax=Calocera viscosa (strain TUFC12733) TaxID=1330018 RepID=A0A167NXC8_CALVF|nr:hypothetical protein CALVIDRAFT_597162 [Calocera viscosa TUFC12733]
MSVEGDSDQVPDTVHEDARTQPEHTIDDPVLQEQTSDAPAAGSDQPLSKNAQRKLRKAERQATLKAARKLKDKEKKEEKKRKREEAIASGQPVSEPPRKRPRLPPVRQKRFNARIVVDLGFDDKMNEKEVMSLCNQMSYTYGANRKAPVMFANLAFSSLNGQTLKRMEEAFHGSYKHWRGVDWWSDGYEHLWKEQDAVPGENGSEMPSETKTTLATAPKESIVYLTADGDEEISELKEGETYIIGGIVDHNRYKNLCKDKAIEQGIRAARLPIGKYLSELPTRKVLTVNQVFDIMLTWLETGDWREAFWKKIPKRKFQGRERAADAGDETGDDVDGEAESDDGAHEDPTEVSDPFLEPITTAAGDVRQTKADASVAPPVSIGEPL